MPTTDFDGGPERTLYERAHPGFNMRCYELTAHRVLVYRLEGYIIDARIDTFIDDLLAAVQDRRPIGLIADPRAMRVLSAPFQAATRERFWPELARLGVRRNPAIAPNAELTSASVDQMIRSTGQRIQTPHGVIEITMLPSLELCVRWCLEGVGAAKAS